MEVKTNETTSTNVGVKEWEGNFKDLNTNKTLTKMECPIFIIFAEYFGYVSKFTKYAEDWCEGKVPEIHIQKFMMVEAASMFRQMKKDYNIDEIRDYYDRYYPLVLEEYCDKLAKIVDTNA